MHVTHDTFPVHFYDDVVILSSLLSLLVLITSDLFLCIEVSYSVILAPTSPFCLFFRACVFCVSKIMSFCSHFSFHVCQY